MHKERLKDSISVGFLRRFAAILYDAILLFSVLFFTSLAIVLPFEITYEHSLYYVFIIYIYIISFLFFALSWTRTGQTLGMKTWRIQLLGNNGNLVNWKQALSRYISVLVFWAPAAIMYYLSPQFFHKFYWLTLIPIIVDYLSCLIDPDKRALHDIMSGTRLTIKNKAAI